MYKMPVLIAFAWLSELPSAFNVHIAHWPQRLVIETKYVKQRIKKYRIISLHVF